jgi:hypothetical protein
MRWDDPAKNGQQMHDRCSTFHPSTYRQYAPTPDSTKCRRQHANVSFLYSPATNAGMVTVDNGRDSSNSKSSVVVTTHQAIWFVVGSVWFVVFVVVVAERSKNIIMLCGNDRAAIFFWRIKLFLHTGCQGPRFWNALSALRHGHAVVRFFLHLDDW